MAMAPALVSRLKIMAGMNIVERRRPQDGQIAMEIDGREIDIRVATVATIWGEKCVMRILDKSRSSVRMGDLGMPPAHPRAIYPSISGPRSGWCSAPGRPEVERRRRCTRRSPRSTTRAETS